MATTPPSTPTPTAPRAQLRYRQTGFNASAERRTWWVVGIATATMLLEIGGGWMFGSMALFADGWHMGSHTAALGITLYAFRFARRHADDPYFSFGTGKVSSLGGFASGVALGVVAVLMGWESAERMMHPEAIRFDEAIAVASLGLAVNLLSAWLLAGGQHGHAHHGHEHGHGHHGHGHGHAHHTHAADEVPHGPKDHNLRAAYLHVLADALTSILAILALIAGRTLGWRWLDPMMGLVGALVILHWTVGLLRLSGRILLDCDPDPSLTESIRKAIGDDPEDRITDLHLWALAPGHYAALVRIETSSGRSAEDYKRRIPDYPTLHYTLIEVAPPEGLPQVANELQLQTASSDV